MKLDRNEGLNQPLAYVVVAVKNLDNINYKNKYYKTNNIRRKL